MLCLDRSNGRDGGKNVCGMDGGPLNAVAMIDLSVSSFLQAREWTKGSTMNKAQLTDRQTERQTDRRICALYTCLVHVELLLMK